MLGMQLGIIVLACSVSWAQSLSTTNVDQPAVSGSQAAIQLPANSQLPSKPNEHSSPPKNNYTPRTVAWETLGAGCGGNRVGERVSATRALGLLRNNAAARKLAERALTDPKPEVRSAAAQALGQMNARKSIPQLRKALDDEDPSVALAAAHSLYQMHDRSSYEVYYEVLTRRRKSNKGLVAAQLDALRDPKKMAELGFEEGIGFVPFAGIGWSAYKEIHKDDSSPMRAASARMLADDPDPATTKILEEEAGDKSWLVRAAALEALARRGDPSALDTVESYIEDDKDVVRYTAAAATLRLLEIKNPRPLHRSATAHPHKDDGDSRAAQAITSF
jgi:HEAT repeats